MKYFLKRLIFILSLLVFLSVQSEATIVVLNGLTHENQVNAGESYRGVIQIQNTSDKARSVKIYQSDYWYSFTGENRHDSGGTLERSNSSWITFNPEYVELGPNEISTINFEVIVPAVQLVGSFWSVLMVEGITPADTARHTRGVTISTAIRYAVQVVTHIGETGTRDIKFLSLELGKQEEIPVIMAAIENTGERMLRPEVSVELFDEEGNSAGIIKAERRKTFPGTSIMVAIRLEGIRPGKYTGILVAGCEDEYVFGTNLSIDI